jgi:hypothetical protein
MKTIRRASAMSRPGQQDVGRYGFYVVAILALAGALTPSGREVALVPLAHARTPALGRLHRGPDALRAPIDPFLVLLAACALATLYARARPQAP